MKMRKVRIILLAAFLLGAGLLSACKANVITTIKSNGSGTYTTEMGFSADEFSQMNSPNSNNSDFCNSSQAQPKNLPPNAKFHQETRNGETWCVFEVPFANLDELKKYYGDATMAVNKLEIKNGLAVYDVSIDNTSTTNQMMGVLDTNWIVTMPGMITKHNATSVKGSTLTWEVKPGVINNFHAESNINGVVYILGGIVLLCLCGGAVLGAGGLIFYLMRRKKNAAANQAAQYYYQN